MQMDNSFDNEIMFQPENFAGNNSSQCPFSGECSYTDYCSENCAIKELYSTYYDLEKKYFEQYKKLKHIKNLVEGIVCDHPEKCGMNRDDGTGDILGCNPDDEERVNECPSILATCIMNIIGDIGLFLTFIIYMFANNFFFVIFIITSCILLPSFPIKSCNVRTPL